MNYMYNTIIQFEFKICKLTILVIFIICIIEYCVKYWLITIIIKYTVVNYIKLINKGPPTWSKQRPKKVLIEIARNSSPGQKWSNPNPTLLEWRNHQVRIYMFHTVLPHYLWLQTEKSVKDNERWPYRIFWTVRTIQSVLSL